MEHLSDQDLLQQVMNDNHEAFSTIYKRYWKKVFLFAHDRLNDTKQSQDIVQDVFVSLWERREKLEISNLNAWLYAAVRYSVFKIVETQQAKDHLLTSLKHLTPETAAADHQVISAELLEAYHALLDKMPGQRKLIFQMRHEENLKTRQIAEVLNISQKTVQNQLLHSYQEIRAMLTRLLLFSLLSCSLKSTPGPAQLHQKSILSPSFIRYYSVVSS